MQPEFPNAQYHLGVALGDTEHYQEAAAYLEQVVQAEPEKAEAHNSLGYVASRQGQLHKAINHWQRAIELQPNYSQAHVNLGMALLQFGDYPCGFAEYEWRLLNGFRCPHPKWDGHPIPAKTLLIYTEQGAGDAIQFARYLPLAAERCKSLILACPTDLMPIFATIPGIAQIREREGIRVSEFDTYLPLMSLPHVFETTLETIPASVPYIDAAALRRRKNSSSLLLNDSEYPKVGIAWARSTANRTDRHHSCALNEFLPILSIPEVSFYSLQKGERNKDLADLPSEIPVQNLETELGDFDDLAVIIDELDLVISVDTPVAHIAGALGKPVWTLLSHTPDWRWMLEGETTPWYPTMRLFRQAQPDDWSSVIERVAEALSRRDRKYDTRNPKSDEYLNDQRREIGI